MRRFLSALLVLVMCFGLIACDESGGIRSSGKDKTKGIVAAEYVGEWIIIKGEYGSDGRLTKTFPARLSLADDGTAQFMDDEGTWEYVESENLIYVNDVDVYPLKPITVDGFVGLEYAPYGVEDAKAFFMQIYPMCTFFKEEPSRCTSDSEKIIGDWYTYDDKVVSFMSDGSIQHNTDNDLFNWKLTCIGPYSIVDIGLNFPSLFYSNADLLIELTTSELGTMYSGKYSTLITVDNWKEYFSEQLIESFEIITGEKVDMFGEQYTTYYITFKDVEKYAEGTHVLVEVNNKWRLSLGLKPLEFEGYKENSTITRMRGLLIEKP